MFARDYNQACYARFKATRMAQTVVAGTGGGEMSEADRELNRLREELRQAQAAASSTTTGQLPVGDSPQ